MNPTAAVFKIGNILSIVFVYIKALYGALFYLINYKRIAAFLEVENHTLISFIPLKPLTFCL